MGHLWCLIASNKKGPNLLADELWINVLTTNGIPAGKTPLGKIKIGENFVLNLGTVFFQDFKPRDRIFSADIFIKESSVIAQKYKPKNHLALPAECLFTLPKP